MNHRMIGIIVIIIAIAAFIVMKRQSNPTPVTQKNDTWTAENIQLWLQNCTEVTASEFEDNKGNNFSDKSAKIYCDCYLADLQVRKIAPKDEMNYINTPEWRQMADRCYAQSLKN